MSPIPFVLAATLVMMDMFMPTMYLVFSADKAPEKTETTRSPGYRRVSFPRTLLLAAFVGCIVFAPVGAKDDGLYLACFVFIAVAYVVSAVIDVKKARRHQSMR